jgi:predicted TIM-barrel enzyme
MDKAGFTDMIVASNSGRWRMPPGEYTINSSLDFEQIRDYVYAAASNIVRKHAVIVTEGTSAWQGIDFIYKKPASAGFFAFTS